MATTAAAVTPPPLAAEANLSAIAPPNQAANHSSETSPESHESETLAPAALSPPLFINSIAELKDLSDSIAAFQHCYDDLRNHLDLIKAAISSKLPSEAPIVDVVPQLSPSENLDASEESALQKPEQVQNPPKSELEGLCKTMCSREIRRYLQTHLSDLPKLREEVPKALKLSPTPPKLVLECLGKFYLQGKKAFMRNSPMVPAREASILILECFLLMMGLDGEKDKGVLEIEKAVREEAETAALNWLNRLVAEGGVAEANQVDARGLLLFVACFGVPAKFKRAQIRDLLIAANAKEIVGLLRKSHSLMNKIPEIAEDMLKHKMEVDAVDIAITFGLEERFNPQTILESFLRESKESSKTQKKGSASTVSEANKKQLAALKSIRKCLERHEIDPAKLLPGCQISEKIASLEKDTAELDRKSGERTSQKRKANEPGTSKKLKAEEKRSRYAGQGSQHQKPAGRNDNRRNSVDSARPSHHANNYSTTPSVVYGGPGAGLIPESMVRPGVGSGIPAAAHGSILSTGSYAGLHGGVMVDTAGQVVNHRASHPYAWHADAALIEKYAGQPSSVGLSSLYRAPTSVEGFAGATNASSVGLSGRGAASDLYQFADSVAERESYPSSVPRGVGGVPTALSAHHSSYLYKG